MGEEKIDIGLFEQIDEALEERQSSDRRKEDRGIDEATGTDRRKLDRRQGSAGSSS